MEMCPGKDDLGLSGARPEKEMMASRLEEHRQTEGFRHEALFYSGDEEFVADCSRFIQDGLEDSEPVPVAVVPRKIELLRQALGADAGEVLFIDMAATGRNPARIIPVWHEFILSRPDSAGRVGVFQQPLVGRKTPTVTQEGGRGMWMVNQLCDLVQMRTRPEGSTVRVRMTLL